MADFDQFTSSDPPPLEDDPAADFLAREQDQLAQLDDGFDDGFGVSEPKEQDMFGGEPAQDEPAVTAGDDYDMIGGTENGPPPDHPNQDLDNTSPEFGYEEDIPVDENAGPGDDFGFDPLADTNHMQTPSPVGMYSAVKQLDTQRVVPEKILRWREEQEERLTAKDEESEVKQVEWREIAAKELEDWYKHRDEQLEKTRSGNREAEAAFVHDRDEKVPGHEWEKVCRLCDFNPKSSRTTKDVARMRSILLQLKQTPLTR